MSTSKLMLWKTKNEMPIGSGSFSKRSIAPTSESEGEEGSTNSSLYLKNASSARLNAMPAGSQICASTHGLHEKEVSSKDRQRQQRQQLWLPEPVEKQACNYQDVDLIVANKWQVIKSKYPRHEHHKLPRRESQKLAPISIGATQSCLQRSHKTSRRMDF